MTPVQPLIDPFGRAITYLRVSVTDRCDLRCVYCMTEHQKFLPRPELLTIGELERMCSLFVGLGTRKLRLTGGEPLVRRDFMLLVERLSRHLQSGALDELTLTTNGTRLAYHAKELARLGVRRINVSLDTLDPDKFARITRGGRLAQVLDGIATAQAAGIAVKINMVALKGANGHEIADQILWAHGQGLAITLIETMPLGEIDEDRTDQYLPLSLVRADLERRYTLTPLATRTGGPARYVRVEETGGELGFITPLTHNFCESCNRVRLTCTGTLFMCLGQEDAADLRTPLRAHPVDDAPLLAAIREGIARKPKGHDFHIDRRGASPAVRRPMSMTGG
ncbi:MAG: molybdenum cofactor biosynthesis protein [Bradyrhizobium sp.]|nr:molybdenum cofactor biosynthesis protein [Bradyrhizobium sp.]